MQTKESLSIFREYDIRGVFPSELNRENTQKIGYLLGSRLIEASQENGIKEPFCVAIGYDTRVHSKELFMHLCEGLSQAGVTIIDLGLVPTPVAYFSAFLDKVGQGLPKIQGSIMVTGSHNPPEYNGFKITLLQKSFFGEQIASLREEFYGLKIECQNKPHIIPFYEGLQVYIDFLSTQFNQLKEFKKLHIPITIDCGNGVAGIAVLPILDRLEIPYCALYAEPNGNFPNHHPDPSLEENLVDIKAKVAERGGLGFAFDGDGDRLAVLCFDRDTQGVFNLKGDEMGIIFAKEIAKEFPNPTIIGEVKCSLNFYEQIDKIGKAIMYKTGHSNLKTKLQETNAQAAFEVSGHIFFNDKYFGYDDAIYALLRTLELVFRGVCLCCEVKKLPRLYSTDENKISTTEEKKFVLMDNIKKILYRDTPSDFPKIMDIVDIDGVRVIFSNGWGLVRASNTTPLLITRFEGKTLEDMRQYQNAIEGVIAKAIREVEG